MTDGGNSSDGMLGEGMHPHRAQGDNVVTAVKTVVKSQFCAQLFDSWTKQ